MAFPAVQSTAGGTAGSDTTTYVASLPSGIQAGDLLLMFVTKGAGDTAAITWPSGWTQVFAAVQGAGVFSTRLECRSRNADGTEGASITLTQAGGFRWAHRGYRITGHDANTTPAGATALNTVNPPNLSPAWGAEDTLWFAAIGHTNNGAAINAAPANYTNLLVDELAAGVGGNLGTARRNLNAASENPGAFNSIIDNPIAATVAVRPTAPATFDSLIPLLIRSAVAFDSLIPILIRAGVVLDSKIPIAWDMCKIIIGSLAGEITAGEHLVAGKMHCLLRADQLIPILIRASVLLDSIIPITISRDAASTFDFVIAVLIRRLLQADQTVPIEWHILDEWVKDAASQAAAWTADPSSESDVWVKDPASEADAWTGV